MREKNWRDEVIVDALSWRTFSTIGNCIELAVFDNWILVRDSKELQSTASLQRYSKAEMATFFDGVKQGFFDDLV